MKRVLPLLVAPTLLFGCPQTSAQQCPPSASAIGQYNLALSLQHPALECHVTRLADGGPADSGLAVDIDAGRPVILCAGPGGDGGTLLYLARLNVAGSPSVSTLFPDGGFSFVSQSNYNAAATACLCPLDNVETFAGGLQTLGDGGFALFADGGIPLVTSVTGTVIDHLTGPGNCACNAPCDVSYAVSGGRF